MAKREIKFRAWSKDKKMMTKSFSVYDLVNNYGDEYNYSRISESDLFNLKNEEYIIMQSTGKIDKNGGEIFEGDIVVADDIQGRWEVYYYAPGFELRNPEVSNCPMFTEYIFEVVGNIYSNP